MSHYQQYLKAISNNETPLAQVPPRLPRKPGKPAHYSLMPPISHSSIPPHYSATRISSAPPGPARLVRQPPPTPPPSQPLPRPQPLKSHPYHVVATSPPSPAPPPSDISSTSSLTPQQVDDALQVALTFQTEAANIHSKVPSAAILLSPDKSTVLFSHFSISHVRHAESELARLAVDHFSTSYLSDCILVSTWEPCAMCAGTIYWSGIGTVVYAASETKMKELVGSDHHQNVGLSLSCRTVFEAGRRQVEVIGPVPEWEDQVVNESAKWWKEPETKTRNPTSATQNGPGSARIGVRKQTPPAERGKMVTIWTGEDSVLSSIGEDGEYKAELNIDWMR